MSLTAMLAALAMILVARVNAESPQDIVGGYPADSGEFPYQVSLRVRDQHFCGGAIISSRHIVTAAHCVDQLQEPLVIATGSIYSNGGELHSPIKIQSHDGFEHVAGSPYDIALITLADEIIFNAYQNKIDLPTGPTPIGVWAYATGWGYPHARVPQATPVLNKIQVQTMAGPECQEMLSPRIYENQVCTLRGPGYGVCMGDSGGPLQYNNELIGVVSWGIPCGVGRPDVFTSVYDYLPWLYSAMGY